MTTPLVAETENDKLEYFFQNFKSPKSVAARINDICSHVSDQAFLSFLCRGDGIDVDRIAALTDGPSNCVVVSLFHSHLVKFGAQYFDRLVLCLSQTQDQDRKLMICRVLQSVSQIRGIAQFAETYRNELIQILRGSEFRDLVTQAGYLLCLHFPNERFDHSDLPPIGRMSVMRGVVACTENLEELTSVIEFNKTFSQDASQIHYSLQSIALLLNKVRKCDRARLLSLEEGMRIVELCLLRWEHPWQMVRAVCRSLYGLVCSMASPELREGMLKKCESLEHASRRKFNCLFPLVPLFGLTEEILGEILGAIKISSPSVAGASQLLQAILQRSDPEPVSRTISAIVELDETTDFEQIFMSVLKAGKSCMQLLVQQLLNRKTPSQKLILRLVRFSQKTQLVEHSIVVESVPLLGKAELPRLIQSSDSELVTLAVLVCIRLELIQEIDHFINCGALAVVGCCSDDRSVLLDEFSKFFSRNSQNLSSLFKTVWWHATRPGALQEEVQLLIDIVASIDRKKLDDLILDSADRQIFTRRIIAFGLTSKWRKVRVACKSLFDDIPAEWMMEHAKRGFEPILKSIIGQTCEPEFLNDEMFGAIMIGIGDSSLPLLNDEIVGNANVAAVSLLAQADCSLISRLSPIDLLKILSETVTNLVLASTFLGDNCVDSLSSFLGDFLSLEKIKTNQFVGSVDCRGHTICHEATQVTSEMWALGKSSALLLKSIFSSDAKIDQIDLLARMLTILLLSLKHPAVIVPVNEAFGAALCRMEESAIKSKILEPLLDCISSNESSFQLPLALRRSQGLGPLIAGVVKSRVSLSESVILRLIDSVDKAESDDECALHALNVLRCVVRDSTVSEKVIDEFLGKILACSINVLEKLSFKFWRIRSSATQLFVQTARRLIGTDNEEDWVAQGGKIGNKSRKSVTATDFFFNRTGSGESFLNKIVAVMNHTNNEFILVPVLAVLQSLSMLADLGPVGAPLIKTIKEGVCNPSAHVRRLSAKIIARMEVESSDFTNASLDWGENPGWNALHGRLILVNCLSKVGKPTRCPLVPRDASKAPEIVRNEFILALLNQGEWEKVCEIFNQEQIDQFIASVQEEAVAHEPTARLVLVKPYPHLPVFRDLLVACMRSHPQFIAEEVVQEWMSVWSEPRYLPGIAASVEFPGFEASDALIESIDVTEQSEDVRIALAKSIRVRKTNPEMHALLLLDESPEVRLAASVEGKNSESSLRGGVLTACTTDFLLRLIEEPFNLRECSKSERAEDYALRFSAREMFCEILKTRNFKVSGERRAVLPAETVSQGNWDQVHSAILLNELRMDPTKIPSGLLEVFRKRNFS